MKKTRIDTSRFNPFYDGEPTPTNLICPITGSILMDDGSDRHVMDSDHFYFASSDKNIRFARHPFSWNLFRQVNGRRCGEHGIRFFYLLPDNTWEEYIGDNRTDHLFPINTPQSEIEEYIQNEEKEREERKRLYDEGVANGTITPSPNIIRVAARLIDKEIITVQPLSPPTGNLFYTNFKYKE